MIIVYLGRRGGGSQLLMSTLLNMERNSSVLEIWVSSRNEDIEYLKSRNYPVRIFEVPHNLIAVPRLFDALELVSTLSKLFWFSMISNTKIFVHVMPSPLDLIIDIAAKMSRKSVVRVVHDFTNHVGENWPTNRAIRIRLKFATHIVTFSKYVLTNLANIRDKNIRMASLPNQLVIHGDIDQGVIDASRQIIDQPLPRVLVIGRAHAYKGHQLLPDLSKKFGQKCTFLIAGSGIQRDFDSDNVYIIDKWLTDAEFNYLLDISEILLFSYTEASQSGIIPIARAKGKFIVCTNVGGLAEQVEGYQDAIIVAKSDVEELAAGLENALSRLNSSNPPALVPQKTHETLQTITSPELFNVLLTFSN